MLLAPTSDMDERVDGEQMKWAHDMVLASMREIFACFEGGSSEVKRERRALVAQTDGNIEVRHFTPPRYANLPWGRLTVTLDTQRSMVSIFAMT